jgi:hypothetical protein
MKGGTMEKTDDEMGLSAALRRAQSELGEWVPVWAIREAVVKGVIPHRRASKKTGARYYVRWSVLLAYLETLKA